MWAKSEIKLSLIAGCPTDRFMDACALHTCTWWQSLHRLVSLCKRFSNVKDCGLTKKKFFSFKYFLLRRRENAKQKENWISTIERRTNGSLSICAANTRYGFAWTVNLLTVKWTMVTPKRQLCLRPNRNDFHYCRCRPKPSQRWVTWVVSQSWPASFSAFSLTNWWQYNDHTPNASNFSLSCSCPRIGHSYTAQTTHNSII